MPRPRLIRSKSMLFVDPSSIPGTGNPVIDAHHRHLARTVNQVYDTWKSWDRNAGALDVELVHVLGEIEVHLTSEEIITRGAGYEDWKRHESLHEALRSRMRDVAHPAGSAGVLDEPALLEAFDFFDHLIFQHEFFDDQDFWETFRNHANLVPKRTELIAWDSRLILGMPKADGAHAEVVTAMNRVHRAIAERAHCDEVGSRFDSLRTLWLAHLEEESAGGESIAILRSDLEHARHRCNQGDCQATGAFLVNQARFWLIDHITHQHRPDGNEP